jgi:hypothetical protein
MQPSAFAIMVHPFGDTLKDWEHGIPMDCGRHWPQELILMAIEYGPNPTARTSNMIALF